MPAYDDIAWLGGWEGYRVSFVDRRAGARPEVWITLSADAAGPLVCDGCGGEAWKVHEIEIREVRDLPILEARTRLWVPRRRVACPRCGPKLERVAWLDRYARVAAQAIKHNTDLLFS